MPLLLLSVRGISRSEDEASLLACFSPFGKVLELTKKGGFAFVTFNSYEEGERARIELAGKTSGCREKRRLSIHWAKTSSCFSRTPQKGEEEDVGPRWLSASSSSASSSLEGQKEKEERCGSEGEKRKEEEEADELGRSRRFSGGLSSMSRDVRQKGLGEAKEASVKADSFLEEKEKADEGKLFPQKSSRVQQKLGGGGGGGGHVPRKRSKEEEEKEERRPGGYESTVENKKFLRVRFLYISRFLKFLHGGQPKTLPLLKIVRGAPLLSFSGLLLPSSTAMFSPACLSVHREADVEMSVFAPGDSRSVSSCCTYTRSSAQIQTHAS